MKETIKLLPIQQKMLDDIIKNPNRRYTILMPRKFGRLRFYEELNKQLKPKSK